MVDQSDNSNSGGFSCLFSQYRNLLVDEEDEVDDGFENLTIVPNKISSPSNEPVHGGSKRKFCDGERDLESQRSYIYLKKARNIDKSTAHDRQKAPHRESKDELGDHDLSLIHI